MIVGNKEFKERMRGFTLLELVIALGIIGILSLGAVPAILNTLELRTLEQATLGVVSQLQLAKWQAVKSRLNHRVRFIQDSTDWTYLVEKEDPHGTWTPLPGRIPSRTPVRIGLTPDLPVGRTVVFTPTGLLTGYDGNRNRIFLISEKLGTQGRDNRRTIRLFLSGSHQIIKDRVGG